MSKKLAWIITVDMGYGHQRAAYPLKDIAYDRIITANSDKINTPKENKAWRRLRRFYEGVSRFRSVPIIGELVWKIYDYFQSISPFYPYRDLSMPTFSCIYLDNLINNGLSNNIVEYSKRRNLPLVSTFFVTAIAAAYCGLNDVYCIVTDTDISRAWVPVHPKKFKIYYFCPTTHSTKRIIAYGVPEEYVFYTGFPLPKENVGPDLAILKHDLGNRLANLDPKNVFRQQYKDIVKKTLGSKYKNKSDHPLTLTFAVGGAGAQKEIGAAILHSMTDKIKSHKLKLNLVAGTRPEVEHYFKTVVDDLKLTDELGKYITILCCLEKKNYFSQFNDLLHNTDILWTKPCELCFYTALGLPIIISPPLGKHEIFNQKWLITLGAGIEQDAPFYADEWINDLLEEGILAKQAWLGFTSAPRYGTYNIEKLVFAQNKKSVKLKF